MKIKLFILILISLIFVSASWVNAAQVTKSIKFTWEQDQETLDSGNLDKWKIYISDVSGGPYLFTNVSILYDSNNTGNTFSSDAPLNIDGKPGQTIIKYFVIVAVDKEGDESEYSNEATNPDGSIGLPIKIRIGKPISVVVEVNP